MAAALAFSASVGACRVRPPTKTLEIVTTNGVHIFAVEVVANDAERAKGLMFRKELPEGRGMLFDFEREQEVAMWMQNTYIPLDMIFINADGRIRADRRKHRAAVGATIPSGGPVRGVLEVIGGTAKKFGIKAGDRVAHPVFPGVASWPPARAPCCLRGRAKAYNPDESAAGSGHSAAW